MPDMVTTTVCEAHRNKCSEGKTPLWAFVTMLAIVVGSYGYTWVVSTQVNARMTIAEQTLTARIAVAEQRAAILDVLVTSVRDDLQELKTTAKEQAKELVVIRQLLSDAISKRLFLPSP